MGRIKVNRYAIVNGDEGEGLRFKAGFWSGPRFLAFNDVRRVELFSNLLLIYYENGIASLYNPRNETNRPLLTAMQNLPWADFKEFNRPGNLAASFEPLGAIIFYGAFILIIAGLIYINPLGGKTQPIAFIIFVLPAFCLAYLVRQAASRLFKAFRKSR